MGVSLHVSILVMHAMSRHPEKRTAFQGQRAAGGQHVFQPLVSLVAAMREQAMIAHADSKTARDVHQHKRHRQSRPTEHEKCGNGSDMKGHHEKGGHPTDWFLKRPVIPDAHSVVFSPIKCCAISKLSGAETPVC